MKALKRIIKFKLSFGQIFSPYVCMQTNLFILSDLPYFEINRSMVIRRKKKRLFSKELITFQHNQPIVFIFNK